MRAGAEVLGLVLADDPPEPPVPAVRRPSSSLLISIAQPGQGQTGTITAQEEARRPQEARDGALSRPRLPLGHHCSPCFTPHIQPRRTVNSLACTWELAMPPERPCPMEQEGTGRAMPHGAGRDNPPCPSAKGETANTGDLLLGHLQEPETPSQGPTSSSLPKALPGKCSELGSGKVHSSHLPLSLCSSPGGASSLVSWPVTVWSPTRLGTRHRRGPCTPGRGVLGMGKMLSGRASRRRAWKEVTSFCHRKGAGGQHTWERHREDAPGGLGLRPRGLLLGRTGSGWIRSQFSAGSVGG